AWSPPWLAAVRRLHAGPRLAERGFGVAEVRLGRQKIAAFVAVQDLGSDQHVLAVAAGEPVTESFVDPARIHVRLYDRPLSWRERSGDAGAGSHDRDRDLVAHDHRFRGQVAPLEARVVATEVDDLDVAEADPA